MYCDAQNIYITSGAQQALYLLLRIFQKPDKNMIVVEQPTYSGLLRMIEKSAFKCQGVDRTSEGLDFQRTGNLVQNGKGIIFLHGS